MNVTALLIGLGPLLGWGLYPTIASKFGGKPTNQILGSTIGTLIFALVVVLVMGLNIPGGMNFVYALISGIGWAVAQILTFKAFELVDSSRAMPVTTAFQLLGASLWGVFVLGNWPGLTNKVIGFISLAVIIVGAYLTVWSQHKAPADASHLKQAVGILAVGEIGYWLYSAAPQAGSIDGLHAFLPQALGMVLTAVVYCFLNRQNGNAFTQAVSYKQIISGFFFAFAALTYLISAQPNMNGLATGFVLSQTSVILATLTGIYWLHQTKTKKEMVVTMIGLVLILAAATVTAFL